MLSLQRRDSSLSKHAASAVTKSKKKKKNFSKGLLSTVILDGNCRVAVKYDRLDLAKNEEVFGKATIDDVNWLDCRV